MEEHHQSIHLSMIYCKMIELGTSPEGMALKFWRAEHASKENIYKVHSLKSLEQNHVKHCNMNLLNK